MPKRATIKDVARRAGVSIVSVHYALTGKDGVGEATRARILAAARELAYHTNAAAASLKRKAVRIAASFPGAVGEYRYYYSYIWQGFRDCVAGYDDFNIEVVEAPYRSVRRDQEAEVATLLEKGEVHSLLTLGHMGDKMRRLLKLFAGRDIPVTLIGDDVSRSGRLCCVQPNYDIVGRTMAELVTRQLRRSGDIVLCAGDMDMPSQGLIVKGFEKYLGEHGLPYRVRALDTDELGAEAAERIAGALARKAVVACGGVSAHSSVILGEALTASGRVGSMPAVGCDVFKENLAFLRNGVFTNLVHKYPYSQAYIATKILLDHLLRGIAPPRATCYVGSEIVFQSDAPLHEAGSGCVTRLGPRGCQW